MGSVDRYRLEALMTIESTVKNHGKMQQFLSISQLNALAASTLSEAFGLAWVEAEVSAVTRAASGHLYLTLKDDAASVRAVMFRGRLAFCEFEPAAGDRIQVQAKVTLYEPRGDFQLNIQVLRKSGRGTLHEQFELLKERLQMEGLFDLASKRPIASHPSAIGVITSLAAAALHDVLTTLTRRAPHVPVIVYPAAVQGQGAPRELRLALAAANERREVTTILLVRGGGSLEDLWAFNDEGLARDIAASPIPVVAGVGHESDTTIADFVADLRAPTPTAAAELACVSREALLIRVHQQKDALASRMAYRLERLSQRLDQLGYRLVSPQQRLGQRAQRLALLTQRLIHLGPDPQKLRSVIQMRLAALRACYTARYVAAQSRLKLARTRLDGLAPTAALSRGFAIVRSKDGQLLTQSKQVMLGEDVFITLAKGELVARVTKRDLGKPSR